MNIGILGTGTVGQTIASKLVSLGHQVMLGSRTADNEKAAAWVKSVGAGGSQGTYAATAAHGEILFNCTLGVASLDALAAAGADALRGKLLIDVSNPLDFSQGMPPSLTVFGRDSLGEQIQRAYPDTRVVKALNTISCDVMIDPARLGTTDHDVFVSGNDPEAKAKVTEILTDWFGWKSVIDLGDMTTARGTEAYLLMWLRLWGATGTAHLNIKVVRSEG